MPALLALFSASTYGVADFLGGRATSRSPVVAVTTVSNLAGATVAVVLVLLVPGQWSTGAVFGGGLAGLAGLVGLVMLYQGLAVGPNRLVSPLSAVIAAVVPVTYGLATGDRPDRLAVIGLLVAPVAVWLVAGGDLKLVGTNPRPVLYSVGAGLGFGTFFIVLSQVPDDAGAIPLLAARTASLSVMVITSLVTSTRPPTGSALPMALAAGGLDMVANGFFLWASIGGQLAIIGALVSLYPAPTVLLAVIFLRERLTRTQTIGLALTVATAALLS